MGKINKLFRTYAPEYLGLYGDTMPQVHKKVINAILNCKTAENGTLVFECEDCSEQHTIFPHAATAIVPSVSITKASCGWSAKWIGYYPVITSW
jgi:ribosomal protein S27E